MGGILNADQKISGGLFGGNPGIVKNRVAEFVL